MDKVISTIATATPKIWHLRNKSLQFETKWTEQKEDYIDLLKNKINMQSKCWVLVTMWDKKLKPIDLDG